MKESNERDLYHNDEKRTKGIELVYEIVHQKKITVTEKILAVYSTMTYAQIIAPAVVYLKMQGKSDHEIRIKLRTTPDIVKYVGTRYKKIKGERIPKPSK